jgi:hypothetical protein
MRQQQSRTRHEKRQAVESCLADPGGAKRSLRDIARACGVSWYLVVTVKQELSARSGAPAAEATEAEKGATRWGKPGALDRAPPGA